MILDDDLSIIRESHELAMERKCLSRDIHHYVTYSYSRLGTAPGYARFTSLQRIDSADPPYFKIPVNQDLINELADVRGPYTIREGHVGGYYFKVVGKQLKQKLKEISQQLFIDTIAYFIGHNLSISDYHIDFKVDRWWK